MKLQHNIISPNKQFDCICITLKSPIEFYSETVINICVLCYTNYTGNATRQHWAQRVVAEHIAWLSMPALTELKREKSALFKNMETGSLMYLSCWQDFIFKGLKLSSILYLLFSLCSASFWTVTSFGPFLVLSANI